MHPILEGILKSTNISDLDQHCMLRGTPDVEQVIFDLNQARSQLRNEEIDLFELKLLYLQYRSFYLASVTGRSNDKRNHLFAAKFYENMIAKLDISNAKKEMMQGFRLRLLILDNMANSLETLVVRTLEDKLHYFYNQLRKESDGSKLQNLYLKKRLLEDALGQHFEIDDKINVKHLLRLLEKERKTFNLDTIVKCANYSTQKPKSLVKQTFSQEPLLKLLKDIYEQKIVTPITKFSVHNSCFGKVKIHLLDLLRELSFQSISTYGTLFQTKDFLNYTFHHTDTLIDRSRP